MKELTLLIACISSPRIIIRSSPLPWKMAFPHGGHHLILVVLLFDLVYAGKM